MANVSEKGFFPIDLFPGGQLQFIVDSGNGTNLFVGDLVSMVAAGAANKGSAGDANIVLGSIIELFDSNKVPVGHWNSSVSTKYLPASTAGFVTVAVALPGRRFRVQTDTVLTVAAIGASTDHVAGTGSTTTSRSGHTINGNDLNSGGQVFIVDYVNVPNNDITLANAKWIVIFNEGYFMGTGKATGV